MLSRIRWASICDGRENQGVVPQRETFHAPGCLHGRSSSEIDNHLPVHARGQTGDQLLGASTTPTRTRTSPTRNPSSSTAGSASSQVPCFSTVDLTPSSTPLERGTSRSTAISPVWWWIRSSSQISNWRKSFLSRGSRSGNSPTSSPRRGQSSMSRTSKSHALDTPSSGHYILERNILSAHSVRALRRKRGSRSNPIPSHPRPDRCHRRQSRPASSSSSSGRTMGKHPRRSTSPSNSSPTPSTFSIGRRGRECTNKDRQYAWIKNFSPFMADIKSTKGHALHWFKRCLAHFKSHHVFDLHQEYCRGMESS